MIAVKCHLLIDGTGASALEDVVIHVEDEGRIKSVQSAASVDTPPTASTLDWSSYTVLPGLVDSHTHLFLSSTLQEGLIAQGSQRSPFRTCLQAVANIRRDFESGVTSARAMGDDDGLVAEMSRAINGCLLSGPRLIDSFAIRPTHGTGVGFAHVADGIREIRRTVRRGIASGVDFIKLFATNTVPGHDEDAYRRGDLTIVPAYSEEEVKTAVEEAHRGGARIAVHALGGPAMRWALEAGADTIEHGNLSEESDIDLFLRSGAVLSDPNFQLFFDEEMGYELKHFGEATPDWWRRKVASCRDQTRHVLRLAHAAGVPIALGSDPNHGELWREPVHLAEQLDVSEIEAISAVTQIGARAVGLESNVGTVEEGKLADLVAVVGNPLQDLRALREVHFVMKEGTVFPGRRQLRPERIK